MCCFNAPVNARSGVENLPQRAKRVEQLASVSEASAKLPEFTRANLLTMERRRVMLPEVQGVSIAHFQSPFRINRNLNSAHVL